jgi:hypothetical protein
MNAIGTYESTKNPTKNCRAESRNRNNETEDREYGQLEVNRILVPKRKQRQRRAFQVARIDHNLPEVRSRRTACSHGGGQEIFLSVGSYVF